MTTERIKVLIIDDSAFARKVIREVLEKDPAIEVLGYAIDGLDGLEKINELRPDVITLDLVMPDLDGIGLLQSLPKENTPKVIIVSVSGADSQLVLEALEMGAVDVVTKPTASPSDKLYGLSDELIKKVKAAAIAIPRKSNKSDNKIAKQVEQDFKADNIKLVVLGTSTGGPQALGELFNTLPANFPVPLVIALHIPAGYTAPLAERISKTSRLQLVEAYNDLELFPNMAVIAQGGMHLKIRNTNGRLFCIVTREPEASIYHPSIDLLFESAAEQVGSGVMGIILTGMGTDGTKGSMAIKEAGGYILAESESSCVVYGMPRSVIEAGVANEQAPLEKMTELLFKHLI